MLETGKGAAVKRTQIVTIIKGQIEIKITIKEEHHHPHCMLWHEG